MKLIVKLKDVNQSIVIDGNSFNRDGKLVVEKTDVIMKAINDGVLVLIGVSEIKKATIKDDNKEVVKTPVRASRRRAKKK